MDSLRICLWLWRWLWLWLTGNLRRSHLARDVQAPECLLDEFSLLENTVSLTPPRPHHCKHIAAQSEHRAICLGFVTIVASQSEIVRWIRKLSATENVEQKCNCISKKSNLE
jgi:hypothetical protein